MAEDVYKTRGKFPWGWVVLVVVAVVIIAAVSYFLLGRDTQVPAVAAQEPTVVPTTVVVKAEPTQDLAILVQGAVSTAMAAQKSTETTSEPIEPTPTLAVVLPTATIMTATAIVQTAQARGGDLFLSPVQATAIFNSESAWMIAEPGVVLDNTTAWTIPGTKGDWYINVPEGGFTYFSMGQGKIVVDGQVIDLTYKKGSNYLILIRGRIDDGIFDSDRNETAEVTDFKPGHAIWSIMPPGAYVSKNWFRDQLVVSTTTGGTNCGATGCSHVTVILFDIDSHKEQRFAVEAKDLATWVIK